jgi:hypothetical protein
MSGVGRGVFSLLVIYEKCCIYGLCIIIGLTD